MNLVLGGVLKSHSLFISPSVKLNLSVIETSTPHKWSVEEWLVLHHIWWEAIRYRWSENDTIIIISVIIFQSQRSSLNRVETRRANGLKLIHVRRRYSFDFTLFDFSILPEALDWTSSLHVTPSHICINNSRRVVSKHNIPVHQNLAWSIHLKYLLMKGNFSRGKVA